MTAARVCRPKGAKIASYNDSVLLCLYDSGEILLGVGGLHRLVEGCVVDFIGKVKHILLLSVI